jgi:hypothetical protein
MRCPKCGYISFDHLENCVKCNKDISGVSSSLFGSTYKIPAPNFLKLPREKNEDFSEQGALIEDESIDEVDEYVDEDLDILIEDDEADTDGEIRFAEDSETEIELKSFEEDQQEDHEGEIEIDFSQFEDDNEPEVNLFDNDDAEEEELQEPAVRQLPARELPDELSDMSDLAHPGKSPEPERPAESSSSDLSDLELDDLYFDLGLDDTDEDQPAQKRAPEESVLSLDDIDFSDALAGGSSNKKSGSMDDDLDFDLDLGGLSIHKDV